MIILVVDDEPEYRLVLKSVLMTEGFQVVLAENGLDALAKLKESAVDLVISDIYMPVMDGIKFHKTVRSMPEYAQLPFLLVLHMMISIDRCGKGHSDGRLPPEGPPRQRIEESGSSI